MFVNFNILNQLGSPAINSNTFANRPAAGQTGRLFVSTDTFEIYRDNGTTWDLIGGPGTSTITGTGTATQVAYFTSSQAIGSSANLFWDNTNSHLGIGTATPAGLLHADGGANIARMILDADNNVARIYSFRTNNSQRWAFRVDGNETGSNAGATFALRRYDDAGTVIENSLLINRATGHATWTDTQTYASGQAQANLFTYNLTAPAGTTFATPNALSAVNAFLNLSLAGNATLPAGTRQGIEGNSRVSFTGAGTLTMSQGSTLRAYAAITGVHSFNGSAVGTITHLAGIRLCFPDNIGSAINITNNYGLLINDQSAGTGTITYTNRWGIYQEGASDLNYLAANLLIGSTVNNGAALQVTGNGYFSGNVGIGTTSPSDKLHVYQNADDNIIGKFEQAFSSRGDLLQFTNAHGTAYIGHAGDASGDLSILNASNTNTYFTTNGSERMRITSGGNVLIGTTTDAGYKLQIAGDTYNSGYLLVGTTSTSGVDKVRVNKDGTTEYSTINITNANSTANMYVGVGGSNVANSNLRNNAYIWNAANTSLLFGTNDTLRVTIKNTGVVNIANMPTSSAGLSAGDLWNNSGVVNIV